MASPFSSRANRLSIRKEVLDDIASRFLINLPHEEKEDVMKVCDHLETAYWFYLDFLRPDDHSLPACNFEEFLASMFDHCSYDIPNNLSLETLIGQWKSRKYRKPVRGAILLNKSCTKCVLVQGYPASSSWGFPKGKMDEGEKDSDAAVREVYEEVGFDIRTLIDEEEYIEVHQGNGQSARMFIIQDIPESTEFSPRSRNEIKDIQWFTINDLPSHRRDNVCRNNLKMSNNKFFLIIPFIGKLKKRILQMKSKSVVDDQLGYSTVPSINPYYDYYLSIITPSTTWNTFDIHIESVMNKYRGNS